MDTRLCITEGFFTIKGIHIVIGGIYIDGSFNVRFSLIGVFPIFHTLLASDGPYELTLGGGLGSVTALPVGKVIKLEGYLLSKTFFIFTGVRGGYDRGVRMGRGGVRIVGRSRCISLQLETA